ncbi:discoidin domain-containing protein [Saccharothrix sp. AJ9571]|nr:discoidin domain-containing protein [Saccharothrix sp. AJ9571]
MKRRSTKRIFRVLVVGVLMTGVAGVAEAAGPRLDVAGVTASGDDGNVAANTLDGDLSTRWSAEGDNVWISYDLGSAQTVGSISLAWHKGDSRKSTFDVRTSDDGSSWTTIAAGLSGTGTTTGLEAHDLTDTKARHVRIVGHGNTSNDWTSITETTIHGVDGNSGGPGRTVNVANSSQLSSAFAGAQAGDRIVLADGSYSIGKLSGKNGTADQPITVVAANRGGAVVNGGQLEVSNSSHVVIDGLRWTNSNTLKLTSSNHVRLTRNHFRLTESSSLKWVLVQGAGSHHNRIDHNLFEEKHQLGNFITIDGSSTQQSQHDLIDHNHFRDIGPRAENEMEAIRVGWSGISQSSGHTVVESNLFENCDGDPEIVSVKSNDNTVRYNTFRTSQGTLSHRHGNRGAFYGNFFLGEGKAGTGGIRIYGQDHKIYNNYFEGLTGKGHDAALQVDGGDVDTSGALSAHWRVYRATVVNNTFVNNASTIEVGANYKLAPVDSVVANNVVVGGEGKLFDELKVPVNMTYAGNIAWPTGAATIGIVRPDEAIRKADPLLVRDGLLYRLTAGSPAVDASAPGYPFTTDDMDGQARVAAVDTGADEHSSAAVTRGPLDPADVGPGAP